MAGFFKKLFNRMTGKTEEPAPVAAEELKPLALPEPEPLPEPQLEPAAAPAQAETPPPARTPAPVAEPKTRKGRAKKDTPPEPEVVRGYFPPLFDRPKPEPAPVPAIKPAPEPTVEFAPEPVPLPPEQASPAVAVPPIVAAPLPEPEPPQKKGWLSRLKDGLAKSSQSITGSITAIFTKRKLNAETLEELEDVLIRADLGIDMANRVIKAVSAGRYDKEIDPEEVKRILAAEISKVLKPVEVPFNFGSEKPFVILVVGVNGAGKTTTIGKLGAIAAGEGFKVTLAACDTFRAAAIEQLTIWGERIKAKVVSRPQGADSSGLAYDALEGARADGTDILIIDTAGRLQNKAYLMDELDKIVRVLKKQDATAPHAVLLVLDATTGQNAVSQAEVFTKVAGVTGIIMTKLDGTARGGILVAIAEKFKLPVHAIGVGEQITDLQPFDADAFARAIAGLD